jgi:hypothetical protein
MVEIYIEADHVKVIKRTLTDDSEVYEVTWGSLILHAADRHAAIAIAHKLDYLIEVGDLVGYSTIDRYEIG